MKKKLIVILAFILLVASGCIEVEKGMFDGGVYKSTDGTEHWRQKTVFLSLPQESNILNNIEITDLVFDPQDANTVYLGAGKNGLFASFDGAESWERVRRLPSGRVNAVAVNPRAKHVVYVAVDGRIFKTDDANRTWGNVYLETMPEVRTTCLAVTGSSGDFIYAGLSDGRLIKSENGGISWMNLYDFEGEIKQILINPYDTRVMYLLVKDKGIYRSENEGISWLSLKDNYQSGDSEQVIFNRNFSDALLMVKNDGLFHSENGGRNWSEYKLVSSSRGLKIYSLAIDLRNPDVIYYATQKAVYKSTDGGENWAIKSLPSKRMPVRMLIDPVNTDVIYLGLSNV